MPHPSGPTDRARLPVALLMALQALVLVGVAVFYVVELVRGAGDDVARVVSSTVLILVVAVGLAAVSRGWFTGRPWPKTPTVVWNLVLVPVAVTLFQSGQSLLGTGLTALLVLTLVGAAVAPGRPEPEEDADDDG